MVKGNVGGFIHVGWKGDEASFQRIPRSVIDEEHIEKLYGVEKGNIDYLVDEFGEVVWPDDWATRCQNKPWRYFIIVKDAVEADDVGEDPRYQGGTILVLEHVPSRVSDSDLRAWLRCGLDTEEKEYMTTMERVEKAETEMARNERRKARVPQKVFRDVNGHPFPEEVDMMKRRQLAEELEERGEELKKQLSRSVSHAAKLQELKRRTEDIILERLETNQAKATSTWSAMLHSLRSLPLDDMVVAKKNWCDIQLCVRDPSKGNGRSWAHPVKRMGRMGRDVPEALQACEVNMRGVHFARQRHGRGCYIGAKMSVHDGQWVRDKKHGPGKTYSRYGQLEGSWEDGLLKGRGKSTYLTGDVIKGTFDVRERHRRSLVDPTRYTDGVPQGHCEVAFADGSTYVGQMVDGVIHGEGTYAQPDGEVYKGQFFQGRRHGKGRWLTPKGEEWEGEFAMDEPHKYCYFKDRIGGEFLGHWRHGEPKGRVVEKLRNGDRYVGFVEDFERTGRGKYVYGDVQEQWDKSTERLSLEYDHCYEGEWRAGATRGRGIHTSMDRRTGMTCRTFFTTFQRSVKRYPLLLGLRADVAKHARRWRRSRVRVAAERAAARRKLERRHRKVFKQTRVLARKELRVEAEQLALKQEQMEMEIETLTKMKQRRDRIRAAHVAAGTAKGGKHGAAVDEEDEIGQELERLLRERRANGGGIDARRIFEDAATKAAALLRKSDARQSKNMKAAADAKAAAATATASGGAHGIIA